VSAKDRGANALRPLMHVGGLLERIFDHIEAPN
jgi:hypothetical protein